MDFNTLISDIKEGFGEGVKLPIAVWYSDKPAGEMANVPHCIFAAIPRIESGDIVSFDENTVKCGGGKFYCRFREFHPNIPKFVSGKERYKQTPEMVQDYADSLGIVLVKDKYLNFARIDKIDYVPDIEGIFFLATPDVVSGLATWAFYDTNDPLAVQTLFASGCAAIVSFISVAKANDKDTCYIGMFDPSARKYIQPNELSFAIPSNRLEKMAETIRESALFAPAWQTIKNRIVEA